MGWGAPSAALRCTCMHARTHNGRSGPGADQQGLRRRHYKLQTLSMLTGISMAGLLPLEVQSLNASPVPCRSISCPCLQLCVHVHALRPTNCNQPHNCTVDQHAPVQAVGVHAKA